MLLRGSSCRSSCCRARLTSGRDEVRIARTADYFVSPAPYPCSVAMFRCPCGAKAVEYDVKRVAPPGWETDSRRRLASLLGMHRRVGEPRALRVRSGSFRPPTASSSAAWATPPAASWCSSRSGPASSRRPARARSTSTSGFLAASSRPARSSPATRRPSARSGA
jgi:hypothetical protein